MKVISAAMLPLFLCIASIAQSAHHHYSGQVLGPTQHPVAGATIQLTVAEKTLQAVTDTNGKFDFSTFFQGPATAKIFLPGFAPFQQSILPDIPAQLTLSLATNSQQVVVTASRTALAIDASANTVRVVSAQALQQSATITFGDRVRQVTGLNFFRRSSTLVANPTSQGVSLRGLGSTAASRTLVLANNVPINDPFGGWIYWDQLPSLAIQHVEVVRGGASDLYGSSAIGGIIHVIERTPERLGHAAYALDTGYAQEDTAHGSLMAMDAIGPWSGLIAGDILHSGGYIEVAPDARGTVDTAANLHYENAETDLYRTFASGGNAFLRGNFLNEARGNGTALQTNATRLWRYAGGMNWTTRTAGVFRAEIFQSQEHYRQSFSAISAGRSSEFLTRLQQVPTQQIGGSAQWTRIFRPWFTVIAGGDVNDIRATDFEQPIQHGNPNGFTDTTARQRDVGEYVEGLLQPGKWTVSSSLRVDSFLNLDAIQSMQAGNSAPSVTAIPNRSETILSPKIGVVRRINNFVGLTASAYRAFRSPTLNELYRQGQVGQEITLANPDLRSERATGWEAGVELAAPSKNSILRASYFWTEVNRPVTALTLSITPTEVLNQRENLGQIRSRGISLDYEAAPFTWLAVSGGYQYANATVTQFAQQPALVGKWIPQVAHNMATMQVSTTRNRLGTLELQATNSGRQYDDDANSFLLSGYFQLDAYVSHSIGSAFGSKLEIYGAVENILDRSIQVGRTPILTLGTPRMASIGIRMHSAPR
ncbi:MAG TPA: TonB-dependent receptor [Acidobacteriaceae bacterium]|nr:TonB-dependent receptor [Acidobacteriaceae bacterium]